MNWNNYTDDALLNTLSDYHKDVFGFRLRVNTREEALQELKRLDEYMENLGSTEAGRQQLLEDGWILKDVD